MLISLNSKNLIYLALAISANVQLVSCQGGSVTNQDFVALKVKLQEYIAQNPDRRIPLLVRNSFHDLFLQSKAALRGCLVQEDFLANRENVGLDQTVKDLQNIVSQNFPQTGFSLGDVMAFAGKIAAETAYPCINIKFKFNRSPCAQVDPVDANEPPNAFINTLDQLNPMFGYLGGSITPEDLAILFAGAHGIKGAKADPSGWRGVFSTFSSGKDFIAKTFSDTWTFIDNSQTLAQFFTGDVFNPETSIIRLPSDLIFYPSKVPNGSTKDDSPAAKAVETKLKRFSTQDRSVFDQAFARSYAKLLSIGDATEDFKETVITSTCPQAPTLPNPENPSPPKTTTTVGPSPPKTTSTADPESTVTSTTTIENPPKTTQTTTCLRDDCVLSDAGMISPMILQLLVTFLFI